MTLEDRTLSEMPQHPSVLQVLRYTQPVPISLALRRRRGQDANTTIIWLHQRLELTFGALSCSDFPEEVATRTKPEATLDVWVALVVQFTCLCWTEPL